jgi:hypothetical protein
VTLCDEIENGESRTMKYKVELSEDSIKWILSIILCTFYPDRTQVMLYQLLNYSRMIQKSDSC